MPFLLPNQQCQSTEVTDSWHNLNDGLGDAELEYVILQFAFKCKI